MNVDGHQGVKDDYANTLSNGGAPGTGNGTANISNTSPTGMDTIASLIVYVIKWRAKAIKYQGYQMSEKFALICLAAYQ